MPEQRGIPQQIVGLIELDAVKKIVELEAPIDIGILAPSGSMIHVLVFNGQIPSLGFCCTAHRSALLEKLARRSVFENRVAPHVCGCEFMQDVASTAQFSLTTALQE
jgi:hypothetical protein